MRKIMGVYSLNFFIDLGFNDSWNAERCSKFILRVYVIKQKIFDHAKSKFSPVLKISVSFHFTDNIAYLTNSYCLTKAMYLQIYKK